MLKINNKKYDYKIENLVVTMNQKDFSKYQELSLKTNAIIANQSQYTRYEEKVLDNNTTIKMITTNTKGVGKNRNIALLYSDCDICVLSDDDMEYEDNYLDIIRLAYKKLPHADVIIFNIDTKGENMGRKINNRIRKINRLNFMNYGAARITFKRKSIMKNNIWFSTLFGGGTRYSSGEDSIFLSDCLHKKMRIYAYPQKIATVNQTKSTWFEGYNEKFFFDKGALLSQIRPITKYLFAILYFPFRFKSNLSVFKKQRLLIKGIKCFRKSINYEEWNNKKGE